MGGKRTTDAASLPSRDQKNAKVNTIRSQLPFMSKSALAALLKFAADDWLPDMSRRGIQRARDEACEYETPLYGKIHDHTRARC